MTTPRPRFDAPFPLPQVTSPRRWRGVVLTVGFLAVIPAYFALLLVVAVYANSRYWAPVFSMAGVCGLLWITQAIRNQFQTATVLMNDGFRVGWRDREVRFTEVQSLQPHRWRRRATAVLHSEERIMLSFGGLSGQTMAQAIHWIESNVGANVFE